MSGRRIAFLIVYAFASMILPVVLLLATINYVDPMRILSNLAVIFLGYLVYGLGQVFLIFPMVGSWAAAVEPRSKVRLPSEELRRRLLSLNDDKLPFAVMQEPEDPHRIIASWKIADEKWIEFFAARGLRTQYELRLKIIKDKRIVLAQDNFRRIQ